MACTAASSSVVARMPPKKHSVAYVLPRSPYAALKPSTDLMAKISTNETYSMTPALTPSAPAKRR